MIKLNSARTLQAILAGAITAAQPVAAVGYNDKTATTFDGDSELHDLNGVTAVDICPAPAAGAVRQIDYLTIRNYDSVQVTVTLRINEAGTIHNLFLATLETGETLGYTHAAGWYVNAADGSVKSGAMQDLSGYQLLTDKDAENGYPGQSGFAIHLHNALGTIQSLLTNTATAIRTYVFPDRSITVAGLDDIITSHTGLTSIGTNTHAQIDTALTRLASTSGSNTGDQDLSSYATKSYADALVVGLIDDRGNFDASGNVFPSTGGSGAAGAVLKGDLWTVSVAGTLGGHAVTAGDLVRALVDTPGSTDANWAITENNIGYVPLADTAAGVATRLHAATAKTTLVDADEVNGTDSAASFGLIRTTWANVWVYIKSKADAVYALKGAITGSTLTMATGKLLGRSTASTGAIEEITVGSGLTLSAGTLSTSGGTGATLSANTFTGAQEVDLAVDATSTDAVVLATTTAATVGAQKWSPRLRWTGNGWKTTATAASQAVDFIAEVQPVQGTANPTANFVLSSQVNGGGYTARMTLTSDGPILLSNGSSSLVALGTSANTGWYFGSNQATFSAGGTPIFSIINAANGTKVNSTHKFGWGAGDATTAFDTSIARNAAGVVEINDGNLGTFRDLKLRALVAAGAGSTGGIGYGTGAGGAVSQLSSKSTGVTLDTPVGAITMNAAALSAGASVSFTLTSASIAANDYVGTHRKSGGTAGAYDVWVDSVAAGSCVIRVKNNTAGSLSEAVVLTFAVIKGAVA